MTEDLWQRGCERLAAELPEQQFNTWIRPLQAAAVSDGAAGAVASLWVPNRFKLDWIRNQYGGRIEAVLSELAGKPVRLEINLAPRDGMVRAAALNTPTIHHQAVPIDRSMAFAQRVAPSQPVLASVNGVAHATSAGAMRALSASQFQPHAVG